MIVAKFIIDVCTFVFYCDNVTLFIMKLYSGDLVLIARMLDRYYMVSKAHAIEHLETDNYTEHLEYPSVNYHFADVLSGSY